MSIQAVIFDMDGLLTDSESVGLTVMRQCGFLQNKDISLDLIRQTLGSNAEAASRLYHQTDPQIDTDKLFRDFRIAMHEMALQGKIPLKKGARELLSFLKERNIPRAVASSSGMDTIRIYLEKANVLSDFTALITSSGCEGMASKPAPDIFLKAASALHTAPESCLVLEDSINGVKAGRAAKMAVAMIPDMIPYSQALAPYCDWVLPDLSAVIPLLNV